MISQFIRGKVIAGRIQWDNPEEAHQLLSSFNDLGVEVQIRKFRKNRSVNQNRYYWGVVMRMIADDLGYTPQEAHEAMVHQFLLRDSEKDGVPPTVRSTAAMTTMEFEEYLEMVKKWAAEFRQLYIPDPSEVSFKYDTPSRLKFFAKRVR